MISTDKDTLTSAFIFGVALTFNLDQVNRYVQEGIGANSAAPFNHFSHARTLAGPADTFVSINNDTVYSMAQIDLSAGPVLLETPDTDGRYYVLQFVDAWTNNFAYVGHRATGTAPQKYLLVPLGWDGDPPVDTRVIHAPTMVFSIVGRWACRGDWDLPAIHELQDATRLSQIDPEAVPTGIPHVGVDVPPALHFLEKLRLWSQVYPPAASDRETLAALSALGVTKTGDSPYIGLAEAQVGSAGATLKAALDNLIEYLRQGGVPIVNGWQLPYHVFDYNSDFFEIGTVDSKLYNSVKHKDKYLLRAGAALGGLWGNHAYEAAYAIVYVDDAGEQLSCEHTYTLTLNPTPPVSAFWSLTMYSIPDFYLVENSIDRYSLGSNTEGLQYEEDGSLVIVLSRDEPSDPRDRANWLPAPEGAFRPIIRMYEPDASIVDGGYAIPAIERRT